ncbi:MAG TPA: efflux RND transporter periplasmic adaptor subunit [Candidatus Angelobacter sp.]|nr:efflux RND transporter periplasmic adaptor subunit [Candidatus Angelobacter sp.]
MANNGKSGWGGWLVALLILVAVGGAVAWHFLAHKSDGPQFQTQDVTRGDVIQAVTATGTLNPVTNVMVGSQISGNIQKLYADFNSPVKANELIAELDPSTYQAAMEQAEGDLASAEATLELNQVEAKRDDELFKNKLISASDHDTAIANLHQAQAAVQIKKAAVNTAKVNLSRCKIYSPVDGVVISRAVDVGQTVAASFSAPTLFIIANDLTKMEIDASVAEADVGMVEDNQDVNFRVDAFPNRIFHGKVRQVRYASTNYQNVVSYDTVISVNNEDMKLKPGMTADVSIVIAEAKNALEVPNAALRFKPPEVFSKDVKTNDMHLAGTTNPPGAGGGRGGPGGGHRERGEHGGPGGGKPNAEHQPFRTVYVMADPANPSVIKPVQVKVGITDGIHTEVLDGLKEGDQVVTSVFLPSDQDQGAGGGRNSTRGFRRL